MIQKKQSIKQYCRWFLNTCASLYPSWIFKGILVSLAILGVTVFVLYLMVYIVVHLMFFDFFISHSPKKPVVGVNILAFGVDNTKGVKRSDTIILFHLDSRNKRIGVLSIPRDTKVKVDGHGFTRINHAYAYGGTALLQKTVSSFLGLPIDHYIRINVNGISKFIDHIGGITLNVEKDLYYQDNAQDLTIDLKKGRQTMSGNQAMQYIRFRQDNQGDIGRIQRQQQFIHAISEKLTSPKRILELPILVRTLKGLIKTSLPAKEMLSLAIQFSEAYSSKKVDRETVPGAIVLENGMSFWKPDIVALDRIIDSTLLGFGKSELEASVVTEDEEASKEERQVLSQMNVSRITDQMESIPTQSVLDGVKLEVLNGFGKQGAAREAAQFFKSQGCIVARIENAASFGYDETVIVDWQGELKNAISVAQFLKIDLSRIIVYDRQSKPIELTLVLGSDWETLYKGLINDSSP